MKAAVEGPRVIRFGVFEADLQAGELRKHGLRIKLHGQPFETLAMLLEQPGEVVTREALRQRLWPEDTFVDFDHSLNKAVSKLREALGDLANTPRFVETIPRRGYRFIAPVEGVSRVTPAAGAAGLDEGRLGRRAWLAALGLLALMVVLAGLNVGGLRHRLLGGVASGQITSIAVLPLENLSGDPEQDYFADGMTEALITELGKISALRVISRQSVMQFKGTNKSLPEIARELNVDAVVEGSAVHAGPAGGGTSDRVRISAQLIQAVPERHLWAESYERDLSDVLALQREIARAIAREVQAKITQQEQVRLASPHPVNPEAYEAYLRGRSYYAKTTPESTARALEHFRQAIEKDPNYALAYAGLAECYTREGGANLGVSPEEAYNRAREAATKALQIDDTLWEAHAAMAQVRFDYDWDFLGGLRELEQALELNPGNVLARSLYGHYLTWVARYDEAIAQLRFARELDPLSLFIKRVMGISLFLAGHYDQALAQARTLIELDPSDPQAYSVAGRIYLHQGKYEEAIAAIQEARALVGGGPNPALAYAYAVAGNRKEAMKILHELKELSTREYVPAYSFARIYLGLGEHEKSLDLLEKAYEERNPYMVKLKVEPIFDPIRSDPRFQSLLRRMNFPD